MLTFAYWTWVQQRSMGMSLPWHLFGYKAKYFTNANFDLKVELKENQNYQNSFWRRHVSPFRNSLLCTWLKVKEPPESVGVILQGPWISVRILFQSILGVSLFHRKRENTFNTIVRLMKMTPGPPWCNAFIISCWKHEKQLTWEGLSVTCTLKLTQHIMTTSSTPLA